MSSNPMEKSLVAERPADPQCRFWYGVLNMFPFIFLPAVALVGVLCSLIMPYLTGVAAR